MVTAIHHATVISRDAPKIVDVLTRILGLPVLATHAVDLADVRDLFGWAAASGTATLTILGDGSRGLVEIVQVDDAAKESTRARPTEGITQLAVAVRDLDRVLDELADVLTAHIRGPIQVKLGDVEATVASVTIGGLHLQLTAVA